LTNVVVEGNRIVSLNGFNIGAVIDCSGSAEVARATGADCLATDETTQSPAIIFPLCNVTRELGTHAAVAQVFLPLARAGFPPLSFQPNLEANTITVKFFGRAERVCDVIAFLQKNVSGFEHCRMPLPEFAAAQRAGRMIVGQYLLTSADVLAGRKFSDAVARGAWPHRAMERGRRGAVQVFAAGRALRNPRALVASCTRAESVHGRQDPQRGRGCHCCGRVMGCCLATGAAAGILAANYLKTLQSK
jgi:FAD dependent oxidoreductase